MTSMRRICPVLVLIGVVAASYALARSLDPRPFGGIVDCNGNLVADEIDIAEGTSADCDGNGIPDECDTEVGFVPHPMTHELDAPNDAFPADLDGDGDLDIISSFRVDDRIDWFENLDGIGGFGPPRNISTATDYPQSVYAADLDRDGDLDVLSASRVDDKIAWYENLDGLGTFGPQQVISVNSDGAVAVLAADLDGDGDEDVLSTSEGDDKIAWYENDGTGGLGSQRVIAILDGAAAMHVADLDGDGDADILAGNSGTDDDGFDLVLEIIWFQNVDGLGGFGPPQAIATDQPGFADVHAADLDGDGDLDVLSGTSYSGDGDLAWFENIDGAGSFGSKRLIASGSFRNVQAGDMDGDGDLDVLSTSGYPLYRIAWHRNLDGDGHFGPPLTIVNLGDPHSVVPADVDGDGDIDTVVAASTIDIVAWYENTADDCNGNRSPDSCDTGGASADCNLDGVPDECEVANASDCNGNGQPDDCDLTVGSSQDCNSDGVPDECEFDCNGNGLPDSCDLVGGASLDCNANKTPDECEADCNGNDVADGCDISGADSEDCDANGVPDECEPDCDENGVADACDPDCNHNGLADVCDLDGGTSADCNLNGIPDECDTRPTFSVHTISTAADGARTVSAVDVDGDGDLDAVSASQWDHKIAWYENLDGAGGFGAERTISLEAVGAQAEHAADLDGDGDVDVLSASIADNKIAWYENLDGQGTFGAQQVISTAAFSPYSLFAADLDGDDDLDLLSASLVDDKIAWYENLDGEASFGPQQVISLDAEAARSVFAADVDGDGDVDALSASFDDGDLAWYENLDGAGTFGAEQLISHGADGAMAIHGADVDGDGDIDVLSASYDDNKVSLHENLGAGNFGSRQVLSPSFNGARSVHAADLDQDGDLDVLSAAEVGAQPVGVEGINWFENMSGSAGFGPLSPVSNHADGGVFTVAGDLDGDGDTDVLAAAHLNDTIAWYENLGDDCNGNQVPDLCEPDCNGNGAVDECELSAGLSVDCNRNGVPDECDSVCTTCDTDGDDCLDDLDCDPTDDTVWAEPLSIDSLTLTHSAPTTTLTWLPPADAGADAARYDTLRSSDSSDFGSGVVCLEADQTDATTADGEQPASGALFSYLIRVENDCPGGTGSMGSDSDGVPRSGAICP